MIRFKLLLLCSSVLILMQPLFGMNRIERPVRGFTQYLSKSYHSWHSWGVVARLVPETKSGKAINQPIAFFTQLEDRILGASAGGHFVTWRTKKLGEGNYFDYLEDLKQGGTKTVMAELINNEGIQRPIDCVFEFPSKDRNPFYHSTKTRTLYRLDYEFMRPNPGDDKVIYPDGISVHSMQYKQDEFSNPYIEDYNKKLSLQSTFNENLEGFFETDEKITVSKIGLNQVVLGTNTGRIFVFNKNLGKLLREDILTFNLRMHNTSIVGVDISTDGSQIITSDKDNLILVWQKGAGNLGEMPNQGKVRSEVLPGKKTETKDLIELEERVVILEDESDPVSETDLDEQWKKWLNEHSSVEFNVNALISNELASERVRLAGIGLQNYSLIKDEAGIFDELSPMKHAHLLRALLYLSSPRNASLNDVIESLRAYEASQGSKSPLLLLAHARLMIRSQSQEGRIQAKSLLLKLIELNTYFEKWLSPQEMDLLKQELKRKLKKEVKKLLPISIDLQNEELIALDKNWKKLSSELSINTSTDHPMNKLLELTALREVKRTALTFFAEALHAQKKIKEKNLPQKKVLLTPSLNYIFVGNPGTGKTSAAILYAELLQEAGLRPKGRFIHMTATEALRKGHNSFASELASLTGGRPKLAPSPFLRTGIKVEVFNKTDNHWYRATVKTIGNNEITVLYSDQTLEDVPLSRVRIVGSNPEIPLGGVLFLDEVQNLSPISNREGAAILGEIMAAAEEHRDKLTIILAGYKDEFEKELLTHDPGLASRFKMISFEDFSEYELGVIWREFLKKEGWTCSDDVTQIAVGRAMRGVGKKGFANARSVRTLFESAASHAKSALFLGGSDKQEILIEHLVGKEPTRENYPLLNDALNKLEGLTGINRAKEAIRQLLNVAQSNYKRELKGQNQDLVILNRIFVGNPGTGKTSVAKLYGQILKELRFLTDGDVVYRTASDFIGQAVGESTGKAKAILEMAKGKVLLIDEAYNLDDHSINVLVEKITGNPGEDQCVILVGYEDQMLKMIRDGNPGLRRRFHPELIKFEDFSDEELLEILSQECEKQNVSAAFKVKKQAVAVLARRRNLVHFGNAGAVNTLVCEAVSKMNLRNSLQEGNIKDRELIFDDVDAVSKSQLDPETALASVKGHGAIETELRQLSKLIALRRQEGGSMEGLVGHYVFLGPPGTGKTTVARTMGDILYAYGILGTNKVVETSAQDLIAGYVGQTAPLVKEKMKEAQGGVLFIDEAYLLGQGGFGSDAVGELLTNLTLPQFMEGKTVVILSGYPKEIHDMLEQNPGLKSRFQRFIHFEEWSVEKAISFVKEHLKNVRQNALFSLSDEARPILVEGFSLLKQRKGWANGRDAKEMVRRLLEQRDLRLADVNSPEFIDRFLITKDDATKAVDSFLKTRPISSLSKSLSPISFSKAQMAQNLFAAPSQQLFSIESTPEKKEHVYEQIYAESQKNDLAELTQIDVELDQDKGKDEDSIETMEPEEELAEGVAKDIYTQENLKKVAQFLGRCPGNKRWIPNGNKGWKCESNVHFLSKAEVDGYFKNLL